jgi:hypothetical protein
MAADLSLAFGLDGKLYALGISGDGMREKVPEAALALAVSTDGGRSFGPRSLLGETVDHPDGSFSVSDKPWMGLDRGTESPYRGSLYFAWTRIRVRKRADGYDLERDLVFSYSRDSGRTPSRPIPVAKGGAGAQIAVRPDGVVDLVWVEEDEERSSRVLHGFSRDGGRSFSTPAAIESVAGAEESFDLPALTVSPAGALAACWPRGPLAGSPDTSIRCSAYDVRNGWMEPKSLDAASGYPAVASGGGAIWLLAYHAKRNTLRVSLHCSRDGRAFEEIQTLSEAVLSEEKFCARAGLSCRKDPEAFTPGDYVGLAASPRRLAAAYVLPGDQAVVTVVALGESACSIGGSSSFRN